uniref:Uncharacterized protein n=1 Tax=Triticum urartu TaxID=4572 RepID=A0A8R7UX62_TRIUA
GSIKLNFSRALHRHGHGRRHSRELLEPLLQFGLLGPEAGVVAQHAAAVPDDAVELVEQLAVGAAEVHHLRPQLAQLLLLPHARPPRRLPVRHHPPPPPLLREAAA